MYSSATSIQKCLGPLTPLTQQIQNARPALMAPSYILLRIQNRKSWHGVDRENLCLICCIALSSRTRCVM